MTKKSVAILFVDSMLKYKINFILSAIAGAFLFTTFVYIIWIVSGLLGLYSETRDQQGILANLVYILLNILFSLAIFIIPLIKNIKYFLRELKKQGIKVTIMIVSSVLGVLFLCYFAIEVLLAIVMTPLYGEFYDSFLMLFQSEGPVIVPIAMLFAVWIVKKKCLSPKSELNDSLS
ncbi:MAG: hypothetical protein K6T88_22255 [Bacillus sp. (in: Bacteria)]|nr:hypothetical protein [Bacillus sp. (in: firmicutes)]